jgi:hypothetical protein
VREEPVSRFEVPSGTVKIEPDRVAVSIEFIDVVRQYVVEDRVFSTIVLSSLLVLAVGIGYPESRSFTIQMTVGALGVLAVVMLALVLFYRYTDVSTVSVIPREKLEFAAYRSGNRLRPPRLMFVYQEDNETHRRHVWSQMPWWDESEKLEQALRVLEAEGIEIREMD